MAPKKRSGSGASKVKKKKKPSAPAHESDDDGGDDMEEETDGPVPKKVAFGARFMLFRVLMLASAPVSFARGAGNVAKLLSEAAQKGATWARCGSDGRAGLLHHRHFSDSRVHRCGREVGFIRADQSEIDSDPRSRQVYSEFRHEVNQIKSHVQRVQNQSMFERYCLEYHPVRADESDGRPLQEGRALHPQALRPGEAGVGAEVGVHQPLDSAVGGSMGWALRCARGRCAKRRPMEDHGGACSLHGSGRHAEREGDGGLGERHGPHL